jgi:arginyl-tRNA synthetase
MATLDLNGLATRLEGLGLGPIPQFAEAHVLDKPLDIGRSYLAEILSSLTECDAIAAYNSIQWPNEIFTADLTVPLPKLIHGSNPDALAIDLMKRVRHLHTIPNQSNVINSSRNAPFSFIPSTMESTYG